MEIRERENAVRLIRSTHDETTKASRRKLIAKVKRGNWELADEAGAKLPSEELEHFEIHRSRAPRGFAIGPKDGAYPLPQTLERDSAWLFNAPPEEAPEFGLNGHKRLWMFRRRVEGPRSAGEVPVAKARLKLQGWQRR